MKFELIVEYMYQAVLKRVVSVCLWNHVNAEKTDNILSNSAYFNNGISLLVWNLKS